MATDIIPTATQELKKADANTISSMTCDVVGLRSELNDSNDELCLLNDALTGLGRTLDRNKRLKTLVRKSMQEIIGKL